jgi:hypothetical protein
MVYGTACRRATAAALLVMAACSTAPARTGSGGANRLTPEEITGSNATTAFELIQLHRPAWLTSRGTVSFREEGPPLPVVYLNRTRTAFESLHGLDVRAVFEMRYLSATEATTLYGTGHAGGAIQVTMR